METTPSSLQQPQHGAEQAAGRNVAPTRWPRGQLLRVRGDCWRVEGGQAFSGCELLRLAGAGTANRERKLALLCPFDRPQPVARRPGLRRQGWVAWLHRFRALLAGVTPFGVLRAASHACIQLHAWQLEPALAVLRGATRVMLADEVGLGKTIQAGLILSELRARNQADRVLVLTPAGLRDQWAAELRDRFAIDAPVVDAAQLRRARSQVATGTNPWSIWPVAIASLDFVKRADVLRALDSFIWDVLVVDEAHQCASAPERSAAVRRLAARARRVALLTATPHAGDNRAFSALCALGQLARSDRIVMFRRSRGEVGIGEQRHVHLVRVRCTSDEVRMHRLLERYTRTVWTSPTATGDARLAMIVLRKRALSSATALVRSLERRVDALFEDTCAGTQMSLPFAGTAEADEQTPEDDEPAACLGAPGMERRRERSWLLRLLDAARAATRQESKVSCLQRFIARAREPAIVFTEYRDTARWLLVALEGVGPLVLLHGGLSRLERYEVERQFRVGEANVLIATDAAGEGLNLHHRCRLVVNLELPWNPMRLEQRIGRVDRLGQQRRPHAIHLVGRSTAEEHIVRRLVVRQQRVRQSVGSTNDVVGVTREEDVAEAVLSAGADVLRQRPDDIRLKPDDPTPKPDPIASAPFVTLDLGACAAGEVDRLALLRRLESVTRTPAPRSNRRSLDATTWTWLIQRKRQRLRIAPGVVAIFLVRLLDARGDAVDESLVGVHVHLASGCPEMSPSLLASLASSGELAARTLDLARARFDAVSVLHANAAVAALERERALAASDRRVSVPLQPGMFDQRAVREAEREAVQQARREAECAERLALAEGESRSLNEEALPVLLLVVER